MQQLCRYAPMAIPAPGRPVRTLFVTVLCDEERSLSSTISPHKDLRPTPRSRKLRGVAVSGVYASGVDARRCASWPTPCVEVVVRPELLRAMRSRAKPARNALRLSEHGSGFITREQKKGHRRKRSSSQSRRLRASWSEAAPRPTRSRRRRSCRHGGPLRRPVGDARELSQLLVGELQLAEQDRLLDLGAEQP